MRVAAFLLGLLLLAIVGPASNPPLRRPASFPPAVVAPSWGLDGETMPRSRRAYIRVIPLDVVVANGEELESLRDRVARAKAETAGIYLSDPAARRESARQLQLIESLLRYAERLNSDVGKDATDLEVQRNLNHIEGRTMCEACHTRVIADAGVMPGK